LTDPVLRLILANELLVLRAQNKLLKLKNMAMTREELWFVVMGLDTALRRVQDVNEHGIENVYRQFYPEKEQKQ
jgi:alpha-amylase/alpha-mannosidase (GH57 family)